MIYILCAASGLLLWWLRNARRRLERQHRTRSFSFLIVENTRKFLLPFLAVTSFYAVLSVIMNGANYAATIGVLRIYEARLSDLKGVLSHLRLTPTSSLVVLLIAFLLTLLLNAIIVFRPYKTRIERAYSFLERYHTWVSKVSFVITMLGAFTFFGGSVPRECVRVDLMIRDSRQHGEELRNKLEEEVRTQVAANIMQGLPRVFPAFQGVFAVHEQIDRKYDDLLRERQVNFGYNIESSKIEALSTDLDRRKANVEAAIKQSEASITAVNPPLREYEASVSVHKADDLLAALQNRTARAAQSARAVFETPLGSRVGPSILKILFSERHIPVLESLTTDVPIAGPILSILTDAIRKRGSMLIGDATDRIAGAAFKNDASRLSININTVAAEVSTAILQTASVADPRIVTDSTSSAQESLAKLGEVQKEFQALLEKKRNELRGRNQILVRQLRAREVTIDSGRGVRRQELALNPEVYGRELYQPRREAKSILEEPIRGILHRWQLENALNRLIDRAEKIEDPLAANKLMNSIIDTLSTKKSFSAQASRLADLAGEHFPVSETAGELKKIAAEVEAIHEPLRLRPQPRLWKPPQAKPPFRPRARP